MKRRLIALAAVFGLILGVTGLVGATPAQARSAVCSPTCYISTTGSDTAAGTSAAPWKTFTASLPKLVAGDTLYINAGTYTERVNNPTLQAGTAANRITVRPVIAGTVSFRGIFWLTNATDWSVFLIDFSRASTNTSDDNLVKFSGGDGWIFGYNYLHDDNSYGELLIAYGATNWNVNYNTFKNEAGAHPPHDGYQDHLIYVNESTAAASGTGGIYGNLLVGAPWGEDIKMAGPAGSGGGYNIDVHRNTILGSSQRAMLLGDDTTNVHFYANVMSPSYSADTSKQGQAIRAAGLRGTGNDVSSSVIWDYHTLYLKDGTSTQDISQGAGYPNQTTVDPMLNASYCPTNPAVYANVGHCGA